MIEQFTPEELEIIKMELGVANKIGGSKKSICSVQYLRMLRIFPRTEKNLFPQYDVWRALTMLCDHTLHNYHVLADGKTYRRYASVFDEENYRRCMDEILDVLEKYKVKKGETWR